MVRIKAIAAQPVKIMMGKVYWKTPGCFDFAQSEVRKNNRQKKIRKKKEGEKKRERERTTRRQHKT